MRLILVDIGNSATKLQVVVDDKATSDLLVAGPTQTLRGGFQEIDLSGLPDSPCRWVVSSVNSERTAELKSFLNDNRADDELKLVSFKDTGLQLDVDHPASVGIDRLVACEAALQMISAGESAIVVDAGTAVTIDCVDSSGTFRGGVIYPGADASFTLLQQRTSALPDLDYQSRARIVAAWKEAEGTESRPWQRETASAIAAGVYGVQLGGLSETVAQFRKCMTGKVRILLTGGGMLELLSAGEALGRTPEWGDDATVVPNLVLDGLLQIESLGK